MEDLSRGEEWLNCGGSIDYGSEGALIGSRLLVQVAVELGEELVEGVVEWLKLQEEPYLGESSWFLEQDENCGMKHTRERVVC